MKKIHIKTLSVLRDSIGIRTHNHLVRKRTLNHSHKLVWTNSWLFVYDLSSCRFDSCCSPIVNMLLDLTLSWRGPLSHRYQSIDMITASVMKELRPILDAVLCCGVPGLFHIARVRSTNKIIFRPARTSRAECLWKACCTPQHGFSTASKMKRRSVDVIFLCKLEKSEKYFPVNSGIVIEYIPKHYIK